MRRPARRKLDPSEISWIIEGQISGKYPIRMFSLTESDPQPETSGQHKDTPVPLRHESEHLHEDEKRINKN